MKKVCVFCEKWGSGGIEAFLLNVFENVDRKKYSIDLVTAKVESDFYLDRLKNLGINITAFSKQGGRSFHCNFAEFGRFLQTKRYDTAHFNLYEALSLGYAKEAEKCGITNIIIHSHNTALRKSLLKPAKMLVHNCAKAHYASIPATRIACSKAAAEFLFSSECIENKDWSFVPNGIDAKKFVFSVEGRIKMRKELELDEETLAVGNIGRLCYQKNQDFLLDCFNQLCKIQPNSKLFLVGEGEAEKRLREKTYSLGISEKVVFLGTSDKIPQLLWAWDVFAFPSRFEGLGIVAIEAQAAGLPVICSQNVPREAQITSLMTYVESDHFDNPKHWAEALINESGRERIDTFKIICEAAYDFENVVQSIEKIW